MYEKVFEPLQIRKTLIPNRIVRTAHGVGLHGKDLIAYHEARAKGGVGMSIIGSGGVHHSSPSATNPAYSDQVLPLYAELSRRCQVHGMKVFQQLNHKGGSSPSAPGATQWAPSEVPNPLIGTVPRPLTKGMISEIVEGFALAAGRVQEGGLDGVEIHGAHNYLIGQFLSPALNRREDEYGGGRENRMRFVREVLEAVRAKVGEDFPVGIRLVAQDGVPGGLTEEECRAIALEIEPHIDFLNVSMGGYWAFHRMLGTLELPLGYELPISSHITSQMSVPTIVTGRIMTLDQAQYILESGTADLVSMVRATIADPDLVAKARSGREAEVRPCVGTSQSCVAGIFTPSGFGCVVNPVAGSEAKIPELSRSETKKHILVVGGGPAGMEVARVAALRGHRVELHEGRKKLGGQLSIASSVPERSDLASIGHWLETEIQRIGVTVKHGSFVDPDVVQATGADVIVLATGGEADKMTQRVLYPGMPIPGAHLPHVQSSWDALADSGLKKILGHVVVYDDTGTFEALTVALRVVAEGNSLTIITRHDLLGAKVPFPPATLEAARERLMAGDVTLIVGHTLVNISETDVTLSSTDGHSEKSIPANSVILSMYHAPRRELADELDKLGITFTTVGDANGTMELGRAMKEANLLARSL